MNRETIQSIFIKQTETRHDPKAYVAYRVDIQGPVRQWHIWKRYSDFTKLHDQLSRTFPDMPVPAHLPVKRFFPPTINSFDKIQDRRHGLEEYLRTLLSCRDDRWRKTDIWNDFLALPITQKSHELTMESWLDEYAELLNLARDIRSSINSRNIQQEISDAMQCEVKAKKGLMSLNARLSILENSLHDSGLAEGEERRRQDNLNNLKTERDILNQLVNISRQDLVVKPTHYNAVSIKRAQSAPKSKVGRAFGSAYLEQQKKVQEVTKSMDNLQILDYQNQIIKEQDLHIEQFSQLLCRQKEIGFAINHELENQIQILDSLEVQVDKTATKLAFANKRLSTIK